MRSSEVKAVSGEVLQLGLLTGVETSEFSRHWEELNVVCSDEEPAGQLVLPGTDRTQDTIRHLRILGEDKRRERQNRTGQDKQDWSSSASEEEKVEST